MFRSGAICIDQRPALLADGSQAPALSWDAASAACATRGARLCTEAEREADPDARIRFQYDWLRGDLARIRMAIQDHVDAPSAEPHPVPPLRGDYRR